MGKGIEKIFLVIVSLYFACSLSFVYALDCQYKTNNPLEVEDIVFYENGSKVNYDILEVKDIVQGYYNPYWPAQSYGMHFKVYNNYDLAINTTVSYIFKGQLHYYNLIIDPSGYSTVWDAQEPELDESSIFFIINTPDLEAKRESVTINNFTCTQCPIGSGNLCLNDGDSCTYDFECGSGVCSISGNTQRHCIAERSNLEDMISSLSNNISLLQIKINELEEKNQNLTARIEIIEHQNKSENNTIKQKVNEIENRVSLLENTVNKIVKFIKRLPFGLGNRF